MCKKYRYQSCTLQGATATAVVCANCEWCNVILLAPTVNGKNTTVIEIFIYRFLKLRLYFMGNAYDSEDFF